MSETYNKDMIRMAEQISSENNIPVQKGVYIALTGPTLETPAEYKYMRIIGGDTVGMSTAPEVIVAHHMNIPCFAMSVITDLGVPGKIQKVTHEEIQKVSEVAEPKLTLIIKKLISKI
jgi:purine-nucleoside phosphorylase